MTTQYPGQILAESWDIQEFTNTASEGVQRMGSMMILIMGAVGVVWGGVLLIQKLMSTASGYFISWAKIMMLFMTGGALSAGGIAMSSGALTPLTEGESGSTDEPSSSPTPETTPSPEPTSEPTPEPRDPISLPKIENTETIFIVLGIIIVVAIMLVIAYMMIKSITKSRAHRKQLEEQQAALAEKWDQFTQRANRVRAKLYEAETDWDMLFSFPAITDISVPATAKLHAALRSLDSVGSDIPLSLKNDPEKTDKILEYAYPKSVLALESAWQAAFAHARLVGQSVLPAEERETVREIQQLLKTALDSGASEHERDMFYRRAQKLIKTLRHVTVPDRAFSVLEGRTRLMIAASPAGDQSAAEDSDMDEITRQLLSEDHAPETVEARAWKEKILR